MSTKVRKSPSKVRQKSGKHPGKVRDLMRWDTRLNRGEYVTEYSDDFEPLTSLQRRTFKLADAFLRAVHEPRSDLRANYVDFLDRERGKIGIPSIWVFYRGE